MKITRLVWTVTYCVATALMENVAITWTELAQTDATPAGLENYVIQVKNKSNVQLFHNYIVIKGNMPIHID